MRVADKTVRFFSFVSWAECFQDLSWFMGLSLSLFELGSHFH
jgi:hypothetical protein